MKKYSLAINSRPYTVKILDVTTETVTAEVNGDTFTVAIEAIENISRFPERSPEQTKRRSGSIPTTSPPRKSTRGDYCSFTSGNISAPLPGQIVAIAIKPGEEVKKGQRLLVLEAMKMENIITAKQAGRVRDIAVVEGEAVMQDQLLVAFE